jgi:hypothetical protein
MKDLLLIVAIVILGAFAFMQIEARLDPLPEREPVDTEILAARMDYHGAAVAYAHDGQWYFDRGGHRCKL